MEQKQLVIGCHLSSSKGYLAMGKTALSIGANTFQFFTRNPRGGKAKAVDPQDAAALMKLAEENNFGPLLAHAPYTMNPCAAEPRLLEFAEMVMTEDLQALEYLPGNLYNFHPGSHVKQGAEIGIEKIAAMLNRVLFAGQHTTVLLETMAGKGSEVGRSFEELAAILDKVQLQDKMGVCLDTCHIFDAGYDIVNSLDEVLTSFDKLIGLGRLKAIHLNDSLNTVGSRKDRHACIGAGNIGLEALTAVINHPALKNLPFYLETPNELPGYAAEIKLLRERYRA
jgi:deoxyribonuclease-4